MPTNIEATPVVQGVKITDIEIPFVSIVTLMVKWAIAAIPALLILVVIGVVVSTLLSGLALGVGSLNRAAAERRSAESEQDSASDDVARWHTACDQYQGRSGLDPLQQVAANNCRDWQTLIARRAANR